MIAEHLFWLHVLGLRDRATDRKLANELLARRRDDGTWSNWWEGPPDLSTTVESYVALKMAGVDAGDETRAYIQREGGDRERQGVLEVLPRAARRVAMAGHPHRARRADPPAALRTAVRLQLRLLGPADASSRSPSSRRCARCGPSGVDLQEIGARHGASAPPRPLSSLRRRALATAEQWVRERQEADGSWGGIQPPWVWSILMLAALG